MCRFLAYLGPPVTLQALLLDPPHSLLRQSWAPRRQRNGVVNADGFGAGWYAPDVRPEPARYRTARPMWTDRSFASLAGVVRSGAVLAAVRSATPPAASEESGVPPFCSGRWLFAHNGAVDGFRHGVAAKLRRLVSDERLDQVEGGADSELLFALVLDSLDAGAALGEALGVVVRLVSELSPTSRLNMALTDGRRVAATEHGESLFVRRADDRVEVASEPYDDDPAWEPVPPRTVVDAAIGRFATVPLGESRRSRP
jgi:glutamine amidotransferase